VTWLEGHPAIADPLFDLSLLKRVGGAIRGTQRVWCRRGNLEGTTPPAWLRGCSAVRRAPRQAGLQRHNVH